MCANVKTLLRDIADSLNEGYLCQYSDTGIELTDYYWTKTRKIVVTTILTCVCPCTPVICYSRTQTGLNKVRLTNTKKK